LILNVVFIIGKLCSVMLMADQGAAIFLVLTASCAVNSSPAGGSADAGLPEASSADLFDIPIARLSEDLVRTFDQGDQLFDLPLRDYDGLGPLYTRTSCDACHAEAVRGPGLVQKMSVVETDDVTTATDQSELDYGHTVHPLLTAGAKTAILPPEGDPNVKVTIRVGPPVLGRGYLEAVLDSELERVASEQAARADAIHGRVNHVIYASEANSDARFHQHQKGDVVIGRFGLKARIATLDDFTADALQGDMGITSPLRPDEFPNPDGLSDDLKPGIDTTLENVNLRAMYLRMLAIPKRTNMSTRGERLFADTQCAACHVSTLKTRADYPIAPIAGIDAPIFTDLLLHDMGDALADGMIDGEAASRDWRTAPLIGLRFNQTFMHDGRAQTVEQAILAHDGPGSEASAAVERYRSLEAADQQALLEYVSAL
jgi:CxxC motif-containing protein (DUF1111 family)